jgi:hypothetical protein
MSDASDEARRKVKSETRKAQQRGEVKGDDWSDVAPDVQSWLRRRAAGYAEKGDDPKAAARRALRRAKREGRLPEP